MKTEKSLRLHHLLLQHSASEYLFLDGHTAAVFVKFAKKPTKEQLIEALENFSGEPQKLELPSAPKQFIQYLEEDNRPQVSLDVNFENGMGVSVGRFKRRYSI